MADAPRTSETDAPVEAPKSKKNLFLIVGIVVALLAGGGGTAAYFLSGKADAEEEVSADKGGKAEKGAKKQKPKAPAQYVKLEPPFVVNFEAKGVMRFLQVAVEVMTRDPQTADLINKNDAMIRNDLIMLLGSQTYETISSREGKEQLRAQALDVVGKIIEAEGGQAKNVEQLYFTSFVMQ